MNNPFKLLAGVAIGSVLIMGVVGWLMTVRPAHDELGNIPVAAPAPEEAAKPVNDPINKPAPGLLLPGIDNGNFSLASYRGKAPVLLYFFATW